MPPGPLRWKVASTPNRTTTVSRTFIRISGLALGASVALVACVDDSDDAGGGHLANFCAPAGASNPRTRTSTAKSQPWSPSATEACGAQVDVVRLG
jgi:hypothetical protein